jgi:prevent-host-death family protein
MTSVGSYEAKTRLPQLLQRVARGEKILITKHGQPVAMLVPAPAASERDVREIIGRIKALRRGNVLGDRLSIRNLIEAGRRY